MSIDLNNSVGQRIELLSQGAVINSIICSESFAEQIAPGNWRLADIDPATVAAELAMAKCAQVQLVDQETDAMYGKALGNRGTEYAQAEADANAFKASAYTGPVPASVQSWATASARSAQWSAEDILAKADQWRSTQAAIRLQRLQAKAAANAAADLDELARAADAWATFVAAMRSQLGI